LDSFGHIFSQLNYKKSVCPEWVLADKSLINPRFQGAKQEDAHEFLIQLLSRFDEECVTAIFRPEDSTVIDHFFRWQVQSTVTCQNCHCQTENTAEFVDWTIPIGEFSDLTEALASYTSERPVCLQGACEHCHCCSLTRTDHIDNYPLILIATMMRFDNDLRKIDDFMAFPESVSLPGGRYELYSIIVHEGKVISHGHFLSYVKDGNGNWYKADDLTVFKSKGEAVLGMRPYILFYKRTM
jgi:ubiquitin carboxyl-terminal hydrolase 36/42